MPRTLAALALPFLLLTACQSTTTAPVTPAQIGADLQGVLTAISTIEPLIVATAPNALTPAQQAKITNDLAQAQATLATLTAGLPAVTGASEAQTVDGYINDAMNALAAVVPLVPALSAFSAPIEAADGVLPVVEGFINQYLPSSMTTVTASATPGFRPVRVHSTRFTAAQARMVLRIPVKQ